METSEADTFVGMYVNDFTLDLGERGQRGLAELYRRAAEAELIPGPFEPEFVAAE
jgi:1,4-dihydroxy-6-naphthoate synthase